MNGKILIIEDNQDICDMLTDALSKADYEVMSASTGIDGINSLQSTDYDLVLLDIMLPYKSGDEILRELRTFSDIPVIVISAKDMVSTKVDLLRLGADDYITKPFDINEVLARVESNLRRYKSKRDEPVNIRYKDILLDEQSKRVTVAGIEIDLTAKEYQILQMLMSHKNKVFTKANLYESVWGEDYLGDDNAVKTHISNLRTKLKEANVREEYIETIWGLGYRLYKE
jgi:DNA-binding response OmpR family regulator